ncbi:RYamide receptor-like [Clytia hemisphaerica]|uniref:RYamide receptor-like n=1 Tax=Clytia hemisphaerica TaxID=252671 RepID=UPI0034D67591
MAGSNSSRSNNTTAQACYFHVAFKIFSSLLLMLVGCVAILENMLFCYVIYSKRHLQKRSVVLLVSLSISDIFISLLVPAIETIFFITFPEWPLGSVGSNLYNCVWMFSVVSPFTTITVITIERYMVICWKTIYEKICTSTFMGIIVSSIWAYSFIWVFCMGYYMKPIHVRKYVWNVNHRLYYSMIWFHVIVPLTIIPVLYYRILKQVKLTRGGLTDSTTCLIHNGKDNDIRLTKTVARVIIVLYGVWLPVLALEMIYTNFYTECMIKKLDLVSVTLACSNCCLNPILYSYKNSEIKEYIRERKRKLKNWFC